MILEAEAHSEESSQSSVSGEGLEETRLTTTESHEVIIKYQQEQSGYVKKLTEDNCLSTKGFFHGSSTFYKTSGSTYASPGFNPGSKKSKPSPGPDIKYESPIMIDDHSPLPTRSPLSPEYQESKDDKCLGDHEQIIKPDGEIESPLI